MTTLIRVVATGLAMVCASFAIEMAQTDRVTWAWLLIGAVNVLGYAERLIEQK